MYRFKQVLVLTPTLAPALVLLGLASAQVPDLGLRPQGDVVFQAQQLPLADSKQEYHYSLCQGVNQAMKRNQECGGPFNPSTAVKGGNPPYHFVLDSGVGFPPLGIHLDKDGNLTGKLSKGARGGTFRVCAVDLSASQSCQTMTIEAAPVGGAQAGKQAGTSHALRNILIVGGVGAAAGVGIVAACSGGKCGQTTSVVRRK